MTIMAGHCAVETLPVSSTSERRMEVIAERHGWNLLNLSLIDGPVRLPAPPFRKRSGPAHGLSDPDPRYRLVMAIVSAFTNPVVL